MDGHTAEQVLLRLQDELKALQLQPGGEGLDFRTGQPDAQFGLHQMREKNGTGPRLFCGHVPKEATEDLVKAHFSRWGVVTDVYFPRHKKTLKRRPFCFVTFATRDSAERALAESPLSICGIPIKNLTMVEDRDKYYKEKHTAAQQALLSALNSMGAAGALGPEQVHNIAALLAMEGVSSEAVLNMLLQPPAPPQAMPYSQSLPLPNTFSQYNTLAGLSGRLSAPQSSPNDFFLQQQQHQIPVSAPHGGGYGAIRSASGPLPAASPFGVISREGSVSSASTISDWYSTTSSTRTSLDLGSGGNVFGPTGGNQQGGGNRRSSLDAAMQLRQQLMAVAGGPQQQQQWMPPTTAAVQRLGSMPAALPSHSSQQQSAAANIMQSAFYSSASAPASTQPQSAALNASGSLSLPPIRENPGPSDAIGAALWASANAAFGTGNAAAAAILGQQSQLNAYAGLGGGNSALMSNNLPRSGSTGLTASPPVSPPRLSPQNGSIPQGSASAPPLFPLSIPDSSNSDQETATVSSRDPSGTLDVAAGGPSSFLSAGAWPSSNQSGSNDALRNSV